MEGERRLHPPIDLFASQLGGLEALLQFVQVLLISYESLAGAVVFGLGANHAVLRARGRSASHRFRGPRLGTIELVRPSLGSPDEGPSQYQVLNLHIHIVPSELIGRIWRARLRIANTLRSAMFTVCWNITIFDVTYSRITTSMGHREHLLDLALEHGVFRAREAAQAGIPTVYLTRMVRSGELERLAPGLYAPAGLVPTEHADLAGVAKVAPKGIICLVSAAAYHGLTTQVPRSVWVALPSGVKAPSTSPVLLEVVHEGPGAYGSGMLEFDAGGVNVRMYDPSKTVADLFKFRGRVGIDVALEALQEYWNSDHRNARNLRRYLEVDNVSTVVEPYLQILAS